MPQFDQYPKSESCKVIYLGNTGAGKTGSLCALAAAGYNVRILDLDRGAQIIKDYMLNPNSIYTKPNPPHWTAEQAKAAPSRISYVTITEGFNLIAGRAVPKGDSWNRTILQLADWTDGEIKLGSIATWTTQDILVIDSLSRLAKAAMYLQLVLNGRAVSGPQQSDWGRAQEMVESTLIMLSSEMIKCHIIIIGHVDYIERDDGITRGMPQTIGQKLSPKVGQNFNHTILAQTSGQGTMTKHKLLTKTTGTIDLKTTAPLKVAPEYPLETGLAEYFKTVLS